MSFHLKKKTSLFLLQHISLLIFASSHSLSHSYTYSLTQSHNFFQTIAMQIDSRSWIAVVVGPKREEEKKITFLITSDSYFYLTCFICCFCLCVSFIIINYCCLHLQKKLCTIIWCTNAGNHQINYTKLWLLCMCVCV